MKRRCNKGFTLIEVLIAMAIVAILTAVALPAYTDYVTRARIPEATSALAGKRVQLEQFFLDNRTYVGSAACNADATTSRYFTFSCAVNTVTAYTLQAVGQGAMTGFTFTITEANVKATPSVPAGWTTNAACWVNKKGSDC